MANTNIPTNIERGPRPHKWTDSQPWLEISESLIKAGGDFSYKLTFPGPIEEANRAIKSGVNSLNRLRTIAAAEGRFKTHVYAISVRGGALYVFNVPLAEVGRWWKTAPQNLLEAARMIEEERTSCG